MNFVRSPMLLFTVLIQLAGPFLLSFSDWANVIQYVSGFGMAYAFWEYITVHKQELQKLKEQIAHLHETHDQLHKKLQGQGPMLR